MLSLIEHCYLMASLSMILTNACIYHHFVDSRGMVIYLYVDDIIMITDIKTIKDRKRFIYYAFKKKDFEEVDVILRINIFKYEMDYSPHYIKKMLRKFNYLIYKPIRTLFDTNYKMRLNTGLKMNILEYYGLIGSLIYAMSCTSLDIIFAVRMLIFYTNNPRRVYIRKGYAEL